MKHSKIVVLFAVLCTFAFTSCKKDYTCTCTTTIGNSSTTKTYDLQNQTLRDADDACERYEGSTAISNTTCHL